MMKLHYIFVYVIFLLHKDLSMGYVRVSEDNFFAESTEFEEVNYLFYDHHVTWDEANIICRSYNAQLATLDTEEKIAFVIDVLNNNRELVLENFWVGATTTTNDSWIWQSTQEKFKLFGYLPNHLSSESPSSKLNDAQCLTVERKAPKVSGFTPFSCYQHQPFICQRNHRVGKNRVTEVTVVHVGFEEFSIYSAKATWTEAVNECRKENLQIAEVKTVAEVQTLANAMMKARPGIENAWLGGYVRDGKWRWLPSGNLIMDSDLWGHKSSETSNGCLILDRHTCETPVYFSAKCNRKLDIVCQKPPTKTIVKEPILVSAGNCPYWIGFYPLEWELARQSCKKLQSSLVYLDSHRTLHHVMSIMISHKKDLQHLWIGGKRLLNQTTNSKVWVWDRNRQRIPDIGESFIPWFIYDFNVINDSSDCLNLDREHHDTPIVYGLDCKQRQAYICQPWASTCTSNETASASPEEVDNSSPVITTSTARVPLHVPGFYENLSGVKTYRSDLSSNVKPIKSYPISRAEEFQRNDQTARAINDLSVKISDLILWRLQSKLNNTFNALFDKRNRFKFEQVKNSNNFYQFHVTSK